MSKAELKKFAKGFTFLTFNFIYTVTVMLIDYGLWRLLSFMTLSLSLRNQSHSVIRDLINKGVSSVGSATGLGEKTQDVMRVMVGIAAQGVGFMSVIYRYYSYIDITLAYFTNRMIDFQHFLSYKMPW